MAKSEFVRFKVGIILEIKEPWDFNERPTVSKETILRYLQWPGREGVIYLDQDSLNRYQVQENAWAFPIVDLKILSEKPKNDD